MGELNLRECLIFLDDILIYSDTFEEHIRRIEAVFMNMALNSNLQSVNFLKLV